MFKLWVNDQTLDFQLENEKTVGDFYTSFETLLSKKAFLITDFLVDGRNYFQEDLSKNSLESVQEIKAGVQRVSEFCFDVLSDARKHVEELLKSFEAGDVYERVDSLKESVDYLKSVINQGLVIYPRYDKSIREDLRLLEIEVFNQEGKNAYKEDKTFTKKYGDLFSAVLVKIEILVFYVYVQYLFELLRESKFNRNYLKVIFPLVEIFFKKMSASQTEIATCFQTGKDYIANLYLIPFLDGVSLFSFLLENISKQSEFSKEKNEVSNLKEKVKNHLEELSSYFHEKNYVGISDLIEYELKEDFEEILALMNVLKS